MQTLLDEKDGFYSAFVPSESGLRHCDIFLFVCLFGENKSLEICSVLLSLQNAQNDINYMAFHRDRRDFSVLMLLATVKEVGFLHFCYLVSTT